jgi:hypothetical protein
MTKYGFDYFSKRAQIFNEMARPSPLSQLGEHGNIAKGIFDAIGAVMRKGGEVNGEVIPGMGGNREKNRQLRYFIYMMTGMDEEESFDASGETSEDESNYEIVRAATDILGLPENKWRQPNGPYENPGRLYSAAILEGVKGRYKEYVSSPEFRSKALNPENILTYLTTNRVTTGYSQASAEKRSESHGGMSAEDIDAAETGIKDIISKIHRAIQYKKRKKQPEVVKQEQEDGNTISNDFIDNVYFAINAIENIEYYYNTIHELVNERKHLYDDQSDMLMSIIDDYPAMSPELITTLYKAKNLSPVLKNMIDEYSQLKTSGIDLKTLYNQLESYKSNSNSKIIDAIVEEMDELITKSEEFDISTEKGQGGDEFPGYDQAIIDQFLTTPQLKQQFAKFHKWKLNEMIGKANKVKLKIHAMKWGESEVPGELDIVRKASKDFFEKRPEVKKQEFGQGNAVQKSLGPAQRNESYVMNYMTEQLSKDKFKPIGEFKKRITKTPKNYWEGRNL